MSEFYRDTPEKYRPGASAIVFNDLGQVLLLRFNDGIVDGWAFPSGGAETDDGDFVVTAYRELHEEANIEPNDVELFLDDDLGFQYDFPQEQREYWQARGSKYIGQMKKFYLFRLVNPNVHTVSTEKKFKEHRWCWRDETQTLLLEHEQYDHLNDLLEQQNASDVFKYQPNN